MSVYLLHVTIIEDVEHMINALWWGSGNRNNKGIWWLRCEKLSMRKEFGGLKF